MIHFSCSLLLSLSLILTTLSAEIPAEFENSLGLKFVKIPETYSLIAIWKIRVLDYKSFVKETKRQWPRSTFPQTEEDPAINISWEDAKAFCSWLNAKEHASGKLPETWNYRLPTDLEWSLAAGLKPSSEENGFSAEESSLYPWGKNWPPPPNSGNYSPHLQIDPFPYTSPVGTFPPNKLGLFDLGGNSWEWCEDIYNRSADYRILRGGSWRVKQPVDLLLSTRVGNQPDLQLPSYSFRLLIETPLPPPPPPVIAPTAPLPPPPEPKKKSFWESLWGK